jgi:hypothetical protein
MGMKKFLILPVVLCLLVCSFALSACKNFPTDKPYIRSQGKTNIWGGGDISKGISIVNPTNKIFTVTVSINVSYTIGGGVNLSNGSFSQGVSHQDNFTQTVEIGAKETKNHDAIGKHPEGARNIKLSVSISSKEKTDAPPTQSNAELLVGTWRNTTVGTWTFNADNTYTAFGNYGSGTFTIINNNLRFTTEPYGETFDMPFGFSNNNNTIFIGDKTYNRVL